MSACTHCPPNLFTNENTPFWFKLVASAVANTHISVNTIYGFALTRNITVDTASRVKMKQFSTSDTAIRFG